MAPESLGCPQPSGRDGASSSSAAPFSVPVPAAAVPAAAGAVPSAVSRRRGGVPGATCAGHPSAWAWADTSHSAGCGGELTGTQVNLVPTRAGVSLTSARRCKKVVQIHELYGLKATVIEEPSWVCSVRAALERAGRTGKEYYGYVVKNFRL